MIVHPKKKNHQHQAEMKGEGVLLSYQNEEQSEKSLRFRKCPGLTLSRRNWKVSLVQTNAVSTRINRLPSWAYLRFLFISRLETLHNGAFISLRISKKNYHLLSQKRRKFTVPPPSPPSSNVFLYDLSVPGWLPLESAAWRVYKGGKMLALEER